MRFCQTCGNPFDARMDQIERGAGLWCSKQCWFDRTPDPQEQLERGRLKGDGCWIWQGAKNDSGYGQIKVDGKTYYAHIYAWEAASGIKPRRDQVVGHVCDNPMCSRNDGPRGEYIVRGVSLPRYGHLFLGSRRDNACDQIDKGLPWAAGGQRRGTVLR